MLITFIKIPTIYQPKKYFRSSPLSIPTTDSQISKANGFEKAVDLKNLTNNVELLSIGSSEAPNSTTSATLLGKSRHFYFIRDLINCKNITYIFSEKFHVHIVLSWASYTTTSHTN